MKKLEKIELIGLIAKELQARMTFSEIDGYFESYKIPTDHQPSYNSKAVYVKEVLPKVDDSTILEIASELKINHPVVGNSGITIFEQPNFWKPGHFRLFISHLASFKATIGKLKYELEKYGISSFVAHEDIEPTKEWQHEIEKGLFTMDALCAVLMPGFKDSNWTDQEVGIAIGRDVLVIPIRREQDPYGFIGKYQGFQAAGKNLSDVAQGIFEIIANHKKTKSILINNLVDLFLLSNSVEEGLERLKALSLVNLSDDKARQLRDNITQNKNLKSLSVVSEFNKLITHYNYDAIKASDFNKKATAEYDDDLPF